MKGTGVTGEVISLPCELGSHARCNRSVLNGYTKELMSCRCGCHEQKVSDENPE